MPPPTHRPRRGRNRAADRRQRSTQGGRERTYADEPVEERDRGSRRVLARGELPDRRADLPAGQPAAARAAARRAHQAAPARPLGHVARAQPRLRAPQPADPRARRRRDLPRRARARRARRSSPTSTSRARTRRSTRTSPQDARGHARLFRQFSTPGGVPSHVSAPTPGSIHEGGELGYVLVARVRRGVRQPRPASSSRVVGDGEAETGPLEGSWKGISFLNPARDGAVLPILHLNGYKIAGPDGARPRAATTTSASCSRGHGYDVALRRGRRPAARCTRRSPRRSTRATTRIRAIQDDARTRRASRGRPRWPAIVLRTPKGWTGPKRGRRRAGRGHVPRAPGAARAACATNPEHLAHARGVDAQLPARGAVRRATGRLVPELAALAPEGRPAHGREPARQRRPLLVDRSTCPTSTTTRSPCRSPATSSHESTRQLGELLRDIFARNADARTSACSAPTRPTRTGSARCSRSRTAASSSRRIDDRRPRLAGRARDGGAERAQLPGLARGLPADRPPRPVRDLRGVRDGRRRR